MSFAYRILPDDVSESKSQKIPILEKEKNYPKKTLEIAAEETFICLETRKDILLGQDAHIFYVSDKRILVGNKTKGDIFTFDMKGKVINHFNQKGGNGYFMLTFVMYDERNKEIFIADNVKKKIFVYSEEGTLKRTFHLPSTVSITEIYNFDDDTILAFHEHQYGQILEKHPYILISKNDGVIISRINIITDKVNPTVLVTEKSWIVTQNNFSGNVKFGQEFVLANRSSDTIYILKQDRSIIPIFVQKPSVFSDHSLITCVGMKTKDFVIFSVFPINNEKRSLSNSKSSNPDGGVRYLIYEFKSDQFFELNNHRRYWNEKVDIPSNMSVDLLEPYVLKAWLKRGYLKGKMKNVAEKINISDNPVVEIIKFK